jgi:DNA-binding ferritin-like protein
MNTCSIQETDYHWNIEGSNFVNAPVFESQFPNSIDEAIDEIAERELQKADSTLMHKGRLKDLMMKLKTSSVGTGIIPATKKKPVKKEFIR